MFNNFQLAITRLFGKRVDKDGVGYYRDRNDHMLQGCDDYA
jgi:hypothetical protein